MLFLNYCILSGSVEALVRCGGKLQQLLIAYFETILMDIIGLSSTTVI